MEFCAIPWAHGSRRLVGTATVSNCPDVRFDLPPLTGDGAVFRLIARAGGRDLPTDPRILNFRVFSIRLGVNS